MVMPGEVALVTGATRGIGKVIAARLKLAGFTVVVCGRDPKRLEAWSEQGVLALRCDVTVSGQVAELIAEIEERLGRLDVVVNNAGLVRDGLLARMSDQDWAEVLAANLNGVFYVCRAALRPMLQQRRGKIVNISSVVGLTGNAGQTNYAAAKAGVLGFSKALAKEVAKRNILVNVVAPGYIETDLTAALTQEQRAAIAARIPLGRSGSAADVAELVHFLVSEQNKYITGQVVNCDGGLVM